MDQTKPTLSFNSTRRFGVELEVLAFDGKNRPDPGHKVAGLDHVSVLISSKVTEQVNIKDYEHTNNNDDWVIKPDSSCGMEICTPILRGWNGVKKCCEVVSALASDEKIKVDERCSVHVHIEVGDLGQEQLASLIAYWMKVEPVFMDSVPRNRKRNRYCQFMGMTELLEHNTPMQYGDLLKRTSSIKYVSFNTKNISGRKTVEFRIIEGEGVKDPYLMKNWIRLLILFVERAASLPVPPNYEEGNAWSSVLWLDPEDVLRMLGLSDNPQEFELSPGLKQTRNWFLARLQKYMSNDENGPRQYAYRELQGILERFKRNGCEIKPECHLTPSDLKEAVFSEDTKS